MMSKLAWGGFLILTFIVALPASWLLLAKVDFAYPLLYDNIGISAHIERYAPRNYKGKLHFELTSKAERLELFHGIVEKIQSDGSDLKKLSYYDKTNKQAVALFTNAEVVHLQDVAKLISKLKIAALFLIFLWLVLVFILWRRKKSLPSSKQLLVSTSLIIILVGLILMLGPEAIFNQLHVWIFPDNHQWYFYYEESLMSTMMKAPDLFAYIAGLLALVSLVFSYVFLAITRKLLN